MPTKSHPGQMQDLAHPCSEQPGREHHPQAAELRPGQPILLATQEALQILGTRHAGIM